MIYLDWRLLNFIGLVVFICFWLSGCFHWDGLWLPYHLCTILTKSGSTPKSVKIFSVHKRWISTYSVTVMLWFLKTLHGLDDVFCGWWHSDRERSPSQQYWKLYFNIAEKNYATSLSKFQGFSDQNFLFYICFITNFFQIKPCWFVN